MKFQRKRGVSVIVATLLLIAISVSAAIIVYVFVGGLAGNLTQNGGQPVTEKLTIQSYNFEISPGSCGCAMQILEIFLLNPGPAVTKISAVYYDGNLLTLNINPPNPLDAAIANYDCYPVPSSTILASTNSQEFHFSSSASFGSITPYAVTNVGQIVITFDSGHAAAYGTGHTVKVVSSTGATNVYTVVAGISG